MILGGVIIAIAVCLIGAGYFASKSSNPITKEVGAEVEIVGEELLEKETGIKIEQDKKS